MAGVTLYAPGPGEEVRSTHVAQFVNLCSGAANGGALVKLNDVSDSTSYSVIVGNQDTTNGYALKVQFGAVGSPTTLATFQKSSSRIQSANGSHYVDISNTGVTITGTLTINTQTVGAGVNVFNVLDYGIQTSTQAVEASAGTAVRAANNTALNTLLTALRTAGGGVIEFPAHAEGRMYPFNAPITLTHAGAALTIGLQGKGYSSALQFYGLTATSHGLDFAGSSSSAWRQSFVRDMVLVADTSASSPTGGALIRMKTVVGMELANLWLRHSYAGIHVGAVDNTGLNIPVQVRMRNIDVDLHPTSGGIGLQLYPAGGVWVSNSTFDGNVLASVGMRATPVGNTIAPTAYNAIDSLWVDNCNFNGHAIGVRFGQSGQLSNVFISRTHLDGVGQGATSGIAMQIETSATAVVENMQLTDMWLATYPTTGVGYGLYVVGSTGTIRNVIVQGLYSTQALSAAVYVTGTGVTNLTLANAFINGATAVNNNEIDIVGGTGITIIGNRVSGPGNSGYAIVAASGVANLVMTGNNGTGKATGGTAMLGTSSSTRVLGANI